MSSSRRSQLLDRIHKNLGYYARPCSRDLCQLLVLWKLGWKKFATKLSSTECSEDEVSCLAWLSLREPNPYQAFHVRLKEPTQFLVPFLAHRMLSPLEMFKLNRRRARNVDDDLDLVRSSDNRMWAEVAWDKVVDEIIPEMFPKLCGPVLDSFKDYKHGFFPIGFHDEASILVAVPPRGRRFGFHVVGPGDDHERIAGHVLDGVRYNLERALEELGAGYRLIVADIEGKVTLGDWLRRVLGGTRT